MKKVRYISVCLCGIFLCTSFELYTDGGPGGGSGIIAYFALLGFAVAAVFVLLPILGFIKIRSLRKKEHSTTLDRVVLLVLFSPLVIAILCGVFRVLLLLSENYGSGGTW